MSRISGSWKFVFHVLILRWTPGWPSKPNTWFDGMWRLSGLVTPCLAHVMKYCGHHHLWYRYHGHCHGVDDVALFKDTLWFCGTCSGKNVGVPSVLEVNARGKVVLRAAIPAEARPYANPAAAKTSNSSPRNAPWDSPNREDNGRMFDYPESWCVTFRKRQCIN